MTFTYNSSIPQPGDLPSVSQPNLLNNFQYLRAFSLVDHNFTGTNTGTDGFHNKVSFPANIAPPGFTPGISALYPASVSGGDGLAFQNSGGSFGLFGLNPSTGTNGRTCLPGGLLLQWGTETSNVAFTWTTAFTTFYACTVTVKTATADRNVTKFSVAAGNAGATVQVLSTVTGNVDATATFFYVAIGLK